MDEQNVRRFGDYAMQNDSILFTKKNFAQLIQLRVRQK